MSNVAAGTVWNLPNYSGELFTADMVNTPFISMIGGLNGGQVTGNFEFSTSSEFAHEALSQKSITETDSLTAPTAISYVRDQNKNVVQPFHESVSISYIRMSNQGRLSGLNTAKSSNNVISEKDFQIAVHLQSLARQVEWHVLQGTYAIATNSGEPNQTRGMIEAAGSTTAAGATDLSKALLDGLLLKMFNAGSIAQNVVLFCNGFQRQAIDDIYGYAPEDRFVGGVSVSKIITSFGNINIAPAHRLMPAATILIADMSQVSLVFQPTPGKGNLFYEELSKTGAAETGQLFGQIGLNHGATFSHGTITGLTTS